MLFHSLGSRVVVRSWMGLCCGLAVVSVGPRLSGDPSRHLTVHERAAIDASLSRGARWLLENQGADGAFRPRARSQVYPVSLTAMALWALCGTDALSADPDAGVKAAGFLLRFRQPDGGVYDPDRGLAVYTSGVAAQALEAFLKVRPSQEAERAAKDAALFAYRRAVPESWVDVEQAKTSTPNSAKLIRSLLEEKEALSPPERRALEFLSKGGAERKISRLPLRTRVPRWRGFDPTLGAFSYEDLLPFVYQPMRHNEQRALRALRAIQAFYTLERNPDLTKRYGDTGFQSPDAGLYYYYLLLAKALSIQERPVIRLRGGQRKDWARELTARLLELQTKEGFWTNENGRWWEDEPVLVTSYALMTLRLCRDLRALRTQEVEGDR